MLLGLFATAWLQSVLARESGISRSRLNELILGKRLGFCGVRPVAWRQERSTGPMSRGGFRVL
jgi:hypothetical protein